MTDAQTQRAARECFLRLLRARWRLVVLFLVLSLLAAALEGSTMALLALSLQVISVGGEGRIGEGFGRIGEALDGLAAGWEQRTLFLALVGLAVATQLLRSGASFAASAVTARLVSSLEGDARRGLFSQFMSISFAQVRRHKTGALSSYVDQVGLLGAATMALSTILTQLVLLLAYGAVLLWLSWRMTLVAVLGGVLITLSLRRITARIVRRAEQFKKALVELSAHVVEYLAGLRVVRTYGREAFAVHQVGEVISKSVATRRSMLVWQATLSPLIDAVTVVGLAGFLLAGYLLADDRAGLGVLAQLAAFLFVLYRLVPRFSVINKNWGKLMGHVPFVARLGRMLRTDDKEYPVDGTVRFAGLGREVRFDEVSLRYPGTDRDALSGFSLDLAKGKMVALVGESGAGKTSVANLLLRLYDVSAGRILVDGTDLRDLDWQSWRDRLGVVSQDTFIFHASVGENIRFGKLDATDDEILRAAEIAHAHEFVMRLADAYETVVGEQGQRLSGGQRQRLSIARAVLRNPDILVLDEATSDLDSRSERLIQEAIEQLRRERTVLAIAHRLSTIRMADEILVLHEGRPVERGSHDELVELGGRYAELWRLQSGAA